MKYLLVLLNTFLTFSLFSQEKGATPISPSHALTISLSATYAVVVGISDYQDPQIPDLQYAHNDAEAFANFLRTEAGGRLDDQHLKVLLNDNATLAQLVAAFDWLIAESKAGDKVIIYFSGHGDTDSKLIGQPGFLLLWDSNAKSYMAGAYGLLYFQLIVSTLSEKNQAQVLVITDACHSGKLAGSTIGGSKLANASLAQRFSNETKILSCQPDEFSIEGEQWGGGRGVFSYHLVDGLYGLADRNDDTQVTLSEIDRYLEDRVSAEVAPIQQTPMIVGDKKTALAPVHARLLAEWVKQKNDKPNSLQAVDQRGWEDAVLAGADSSLLALYEKFKQALRDKIFLQPAESCANTYYNKLIQAPELLPLHGAMTRNFAAALQDDAQQALNRWMASDVIEMGLTHFAKKYSRYPEQLQRASELLGEQHYFYPELQARKAFFEGFLLCPPMNFHTERSIGQQALRHYQQAISWQPQFPLAVFAIGNVYNSSVVNHDSARHYFQQAIDFAPNWLIAYEEMALLELHYGAGPEKALQLLDQVKARDSSWVWLWVSSGDVYEKQKKYEQAEQAYLKAYTLDSTHFWTLTKLAEFYGHTDRPEKAEPLFQKAISLEPPHSSFAAFRAASFYIRQGRLTDAERVCIQRDTFKSFAAIQCSNFLSHIYLHWERWEAAIREFRNMSFRSPVDQYYIAWCLENLQRFEEADATYQDYNQQITAYNPAFEPHAQYLLGDFYYRQKRYKEAQNVFLQTDTLCLQLDSLLVYPLVRKPTTPANSFRVYPLAGLAVIHQELGRLKEAEVLMDSIQGIWPDHYRYWMLRTRQAYLTKDQEALKQHFTKSLEAAAAHTVRAVRSRYTRKKESGEAILNDPIYSEIIKMPWAKTLMKKYFPDQ